MGMRIPVLRTSLPGTENFSISGDLYPRDWGFLKSGDFNPRGLGIFEDLGIFIPGDWGFLKLWGFLSTGFFGKGDFLGMDFFIRGIGYPTKKPPLDQNLLYKIYYYLKINYGRVGQRKFRLVRFLQYVFDF